MKIGIFQDLHANLPALKKAIETFRNYDCDEIIHVGDLLDIGPHPKECMELALSIEEMKFVMGNHDHYYAYGLPQPIPSFISKSEVEHQIWTREQIGTDKKGIVQQWPFKLERKSPSGTKFCFTHYGLNEKGNWFDTFLKSPSPEGLDNLFKYSGDADVYFYGHQHIASDHIGNARYINLGSAGCHNKSELRCGILHITENGYQLEKISVAYDDNGLMDDFEKRKVPARKFITQNFITR